MSQYQYHMCYLPGTQSHVVQNCTYPGSTLIRSEPGALGQPGERDVEFPGSPGNQDVIQVDKNKGYSSKDPVHQSMKCLSRIFQSKRHI